MATESPAVPFSNLSIHGFRRLYDVHLPLRPLAVMIGANGTGKTSVLDVLTLLANSAQGKLSDSISELSWLTSILTYDRADELHLGISMKMRTDEPLEYSLRLKQQGIGYVIGDEKLLQRRSNGLQPFFHINSYGTVIQFSERSRALHFAPAWKHEPLEPPWPRCQRR